MKADFHRNYYNRLILPLLWGGSRVFSLFDGKLRTGLKGREGLIERAREFRARIGDRPLMLFHCASAGELEALRPVAAALDRERFAVAISHFSPSARAAAKTGDEFDFADYSPIDSADLVSAYLDALKPRVIAITKHDVWPNFVWSAQDRNIPLFLINGNFHAKSTKRWPILRRFHAAVYSAFTEIMAVSEADADRAREIVGHHVPVKAAGDARYDRVLGRIQQRRPLPDGVEELAAGRPVIIFGSSHPDDEELLLPVIPKLRTQLPDLLVIIVPHDPSVRARRRILAACREYGLDVCDADHSLGNRRIPILLINRTGLLADLYRVGQLAYVGGGFGKGVHSVLEPMAAGLPVLCGPHIVVSNEAILAQQEGILTIVKGRRQTERGISEWMTDRHRLEQLGRQSREFVAQRSGVSQRIAKRLMESVHE